MKILSPGRLPEEKIMQGTCSRCGCVVEETCGKCKYRSHRNEGYWFVDCPTINCLSQIPMNEIQLTKQTMTEVQKLAIYLHDGSCNSTNGCSNTGKCGWKSEIVNGVHNWEGCFHMTFLLRAQNVIQSVRSHG